MCENNGESLVVSYPQLCTEQPVLAIFVADAPIEILKIFDKAAKEVVLKTFTRKNIYILISITQSA